MADPVAGTVATFRWPVVNSGPSWSLPRCAMPDIFSIQWDMQLDSWFYAGHVIDTNGQIYSVNVYFGRGAASAASKPADQGAALGFGIGVAATGQYHLAAIEPGVGVSDDPDNPATLTIPPATDFSYEVSYQSPAASVSYIGQGPDAPAVGIAGADYQLAVKDAVDGSGAPMWLTLELTDNLGARMEGCSGFVGGLSENSSGLFTYEIPQPQLTVTGGAMEVGGNSVTIVSGNIWHDRQTYTFPPGTAPSPGSPLYIGTWMPLLFDNGISAALSSGWTARPADGEQWISGRAVGFPPDGGIGNLYFPPGLDRYNGGALLQTTVDDWDYDVNIFDPGDPSGSPHWLSPTTGITYCNKWKISFSDRLAQWGMPSEAYLVALVESCEFVSADQHPFWEGAVLIFSDAACTQQIGTGFVEQMGYN